MRAYRPGEVVAIADWLSGGQGMLLTLLETNDPAWAESPLAEGASKFPLPRLRPWRKLAALPPAVAFLATALLASAAGASRHERDSCRRYRGQSRGHGGGAEATGADYA